MRFNKVAQIDAYTYADLELLFSRLLPHFEAVYSFARLVRFNPGGDPDYSSAPMTWLRAQENANAAANGGGGGDADQHTHLRSRSLQVITKIVDYELDPGASYEGVWHVEGMSHEHIVATGLYILERGENIDGGDICFKRAFLETEATRIFSTVPQCRDKVTEKIISVRQRERDR